MAEEIDRIVKTGQVATLHNICQLLDLPVKEAKQRLEDYARQHSQHLRCTYIVKFESGDGDVGFVTVIGDQEKEKYIQNLKNVQNVSSFVQEIVEKARYSDSTQIWHEDCSEIQRQAQAAADVGALWIPRLGGSVEIIQNQQMRDVAMLKSTGIAQQKNVSSPCTRESPVSATETQKCLKGFLAKKQSQKPQTQKVMADDSSVLDADKTADKTPSSSHEVEPNAPKKPRLTLNKKLVNQSPGQEPDNEVPKNLQRKSSDEMIIEHQSVPKDQAEAPLFGKNDDNPPDKVKSTVQEVAAHQPRTKYLKRKVVKELQYMEGNSLVLEDAEEMVVEPLEESSEAPVQKSNKEKKKLEALSSSGRKQASIMSLWGAKR